jgi:hypothetical protein
MSKIQASTLIKFSIAALLVLLPCAVPAQTTVVIAVRDMVRASVDVDVRCQGPCSREKNISFVRESGGVPVAGGGDRIVSLEAYGENGAPVQVRKFAPFEYLAESPYHRLVVKRTLETPGSVDELAFRSWLLQEKGILMLGDLLPEQSLTGVSVRFVLPQGVFAIGAGKGADGRTYRFDDASDAVVLVARRPEYGTASFGATPFTMAAVGAWPVRDTERMSMATGVLRGYQEIFRADPVGEPVVILVRPPASAFPPNRWAAQVKGSTALIVSTGVPFGTQEPQRLHEQLRHELFHLWAPNSLALGGRYDWFFEGFAQYESVKLAVAVNRITFDDLLGTLAKSADVAAADTFPMSLIEASEKRFQGSQSRLYARGMLVAFMLDVEMMSSSDARRGSADILRELVARHRKPVTESDGNKSVLDLLDALPELRPIVGSYIKGREPLRLEAYFEKAGFLAEQRSGATVLSAVTKPSDLQKKVLQRMGYNNWRRQESQ